MKVTHLAYPLDSGDLSDLARDQAMAIGDFDGVHLGHRQVIGTAVQIARREGCSASVMTFHPHPREVLGSPVYSTYITPLEEKLKRFAALDIDSVYVVHFDLALAALSPASFVDEVLVSLRVSTAVVGFNFTFGHRGIGTAATLKELSVGRYGVEVVQPVHESGERVSSTLIREALSLGDVSRASTLLGRPYSIAGSVIRGEGRGRTIGIPTANIEPDAAYVVPAKGVYAVRVTVDGREGSPLDGVMNVGFKPTFHVSLSQPTWEVHLFDINEDLYGRRLTVEFITRLRSERKFDSIDALVRQIHEDIELARKQLKT